MESKICGIKDQKTLDFILNHRYPPKYVGFICNYKKSKRFVEIKKLVNLIKRKKKGIYFVAVLVSPTQNFLEKLKYIKFDYFQLYDVSPVKTKKIKKKYKKKIISALTIKNSKDINRFKVYEKIADIILFDGKGYEKSIKFDHSLLNDLKIKKKIMIAGDIKFDTPIDKFKKIADIIDISGGLETSNKKDISKIDIFLKNIKKFKNEN